MDYMIKIKGRTWTRNITKSIHMFKEKDQFRHVRIFRLEPGRVALQIRTKGPTVDTSSRTKKPKEHFCYSTASINAKELDAVISALHEARKDLR